MSAASAAGTAAGRLQRPDPDFAYNLANMANLANLANMAKGGQGVKEGCGVGGGYVLAPCLATLAILVNMITRKNAPADPVSDRLV